MARIRTIKPEFPHSESMGRVSRDARLTFIQMWTLADDSGRLRGNSRMLASLLFPYDDDAKKLIDGWLGELERENCIDRYSVDCTAYIQIRNWLNHQKIDKPSASKLPAFDESSRILANPRERSSEDLDLDLEGIKEGKGPGSISSSATTAQPVGEVSHSKADEETVFAHWKREWDHPGAIFDPKRRGRIRARLKDFSADQLCSAISGFKHSPWHCGTDPKSDGKVYDAIDTLLRDTEQVETGLRLLARPPRPPPRHENATERILRGLAEDDSRVIEHDSEPERFLLAR